MNPNRRLGGASGSHSVHMEAFKDLSVEVERSTHPVLFDQRFHNDAAMVSIADGCPRGGLPTPRLPAAASRSNIASLYTRALSCVPVPTRRTLRETLRRGGRGWPTW